MSNITKEFFYRRGLFDHKSLTVKFGGEHSKAANIFTATALKVPDYYYYRKDRESLGGGWYGANVEKVKYTETNCYLIMKDDACIGMMFPYREHDIKSDLLPISSYPKLFMEKSKITYKPLNQ